MHGDYIATKGGSMDQSIFPEDVLLRVGYYLFFLERRRPGFGLYDFLVSVGRTTAVSIARYCLQDNLEYLRHIWRSFNEILMESRSQLRSVAACSYESRHEVLRIKLLAWMKYNKSKWKKICLGSSLATNTLTISLTLRTTDLRNFLCDHRHQPHQTCTPKGLKHFCGSSNCETIANFTGSDLRNAVILSFDESEGVSEGAAEGDSICSQRTLNDVYHFIRNEESKKVRLTLGRKEDAIFNFPPIVIQLGLAEVLKEMAKNNALKIHAKYQIFENHHPLTMLYCALSRWTRDTSCLSYLQTMMPRDQVHARHPFGRRKAQSNYSCGPIHACLKANSLTIEMACGYATVDEINALDNRHQTALMFYILYIGKKLSSHSSRSSFCFLFDDLQRYFRNIRILLSAGVCPLRKDSYGNSPMAVVEDYIHGFESDEYNYSELVCFFWEEVQKELFSRNEPYMYSS